MEEHQIHLVKVDTAGMPADFLTKFVGKAKLIKSLARATNSGQALPPQCPVTVMGQGREGARPRPPEQRSESAHRRSGEGA